MDNIKNDEYYLQKLIANIDFCIETLKDISKDEFNESEVYQNAIMFSFIQISENASRLSDNYKEKHNLVPWNQIKGMRNKIVHDYEIVDGNIIYDTVKQDLPSFRKAISL